MAESSSSNAAAGQILATLRQTREWPGIAAALSSLKEAFGRAPGKWSLWHELVGTCDPPGDVSVFSTEDEAWQAGVDQVAERLHPDAGLAAKIVAVVFAANDGNPDRLKSLEITDAELDDIEPLTSLHGLQSLQIDQSEDMPGPLDDLSPLASLPELTSVSLTCGVDDLTPVARIPKLHELLLVYCDNVSDLGPLAKSETLEVLCLDGCSGIDDVSALAECKRLKKLTLSSLSNVDDLGPLAHFKGELELEDMEHAENAG